MKTTDLYSQLCEEHVLREAWEIVRRKNTRGGLDGISPEDLDGRIEKIIKNLSHDLSTGIYSPAPYQQFRIPKNAAANEWRTLSMPIVADKIVQQAFLHVAGPVIEKQFLDCSYAYRAGKGPIKAIRRLIHIIGGKKEGVLIRFDIDNFFDSLNRPRLVNETSRMLNYGYGILYQRVWDAVVMAGLNPNISYLHSFQNKKPTLIFDVIEEFRQALVDRPLFSLMTKGKKHRKFKVDPKSGLLDTYTRQTVLENVLNRLSTLINFRGGKVQAGVTLWTDWQGKGTDGNYWRKVVMGIRLQTTGIRKCCSALKIEEDF